MSAALGLATVAVLVVVELFGPAQVLPLSPDDRLAPDLARAA